MEFDGWHYPYTSRRMTHYARRGMVCASQPLAAQAGLDMLKQGGNAVDAAVATAASLTVLEPTSNGIGGDAFALVWANDRLHGLNSSGPAPAAISIDEVKRRGHEKMPTSGWLPVTVPGAPRAWAELSARFGKLPFAKLLEPAIQYAREGYPVSPTLGRNWAGAANRLNRDWQGREFRAWNETFTIEGNMPRIGQVWRSADHARTLEAIANSKAADFYEGELAERIDRCAREHGGFLRKADLQQYQAEWVEPVGLHYKGYDVWELPPNGQGLNALMALQLMKTFPVERMDPAEVSHLQIEAIKLAFADGFHYITDPRYMRIGAEALLSESYAETRRRLITDRAAVPRFGTPTPGGTVYLAAADGEGNMVSYIQSNYQGFGSGIVIPGTGIAMQNRGSEFSLDPEHANALQPRKRTYHTIIPGFLTREGRAVGPFGVMGGFMQPQGHLQLLMNAIDSKLNPQAVLDAPRWMWTEHLTIKVELNVPDSIAEALADRGHRIVRAKDERGFGRGQIIWRDADSGVLAGATDPRTDGSVASW